MWENETVVLVTSLKKRILSGKDRIRFRKISSESAVPNFIKALFKGCVETYLDKEKPLTVQSTPHFDLKPDDLETLRNRFLDVFREAAVFSDKEVESILREALVLRLNYLVKPVDTMRRLLYDKKETVDQAEMEAVLGSFTNVLPYAEDVQGECQRLGKTTISREEFGKIVTDLLHRFEENDPVKIVLRDLNVLTEFLSETKGEEITRIEGSVLQDFLADRNFWGFRRAVDVELKLGKEDFDVMDIEMTMKRYLELKDEFSKDSQAEEEVQTEEAIEEKKEKQEKKKDIIELVEESPKEEEPLVVVEDKLQLDDMLDVESVVEKQAEESEETEEMKEEKKEEVSQKSMRIIRRTGKKEEDKPDTKSDAEEDVEPGQRKGLREFIETKTEKVFIKKLFGGDGAEYEQLINKLDEAESWRVAKILIDNELFKRDVDPFSREAIKLVDLVYGLYYPEEGVGGKK